MQQDPRAYLETDARIIAENDTHAAIVVRVDKAWFSRNLLFLAALAKMLRPVEIPKAVHDAEGPGV
jgi:hypothetical protein